MTDSRSRSRRIAIERGEPAPRFDTLARWPVDELRYALRIQEATGIHWGPGICGHNARGSAWCADCLRAEIARRGHG